MYKIVFIPTGHIFSLPDDAAKELKSKYPAEYKIIEKNGKRFRDRIKKQEKIQNDKSILSKILDEGEEQ